MPASNNITSSRGVLFLIIVATAGFYLGSQIGSEVISPTPQSPIVDLPSNTKVESKSDQARREDVESVPKTNLRLKNNDLVNWISMGELEDVIDNVDVLVFDTRSMKKYKAKHIKGAEPLLISWLDAYGSKIPEDKTIVLYGDEATFSTSKLAYTKLGGPDLENVHLLSATFTDWVNGGNPVDIGNIYEE